MKQQKTSLNTIKTIFIKSENSNFFILLAIITTTCFLVDFYYPTSHLLIPFLLTTIISSLITFLTIPKLKEIKAKQIIREEGPQHHLIKEGTPTMGGIFMIPIGIIIANIIYINKEDYFVVISLSFLIICFMFIGLIDDLLSLKKKSNVGLTPKAKLILQVFVSLIFIYLCQLNNFLPNNIYIPNKIINIGYLIYPLGLFVIIAESNSTNLTDGLDGLLSGCSALIFTGLAMDILIKNQNNDYSLDQLCISMAGACMGFLLLNKNPAKIFMGDSGSLAIGASLGAIALITNNLWSLFVMGGIFVAESLSVIIQVAFFKITKKITGKGQRLFLMTPIHHHFELQGNHENFIVKSFWLVTLLLVIINLLFW